MGVKLCVWAIVLCPTGVLACSDAETRYFTCTFGAGKKTIEICHDAKMARYRFGPTGEAPELELLQPVSNVDLTPWPGVGRTIWEEVTFRNADHAYVVYGSIDRGPPSDGSDEMAVTLSGGITVRRDGDEIAHLTCDPGSVKFPWGTSLFDAKETAGQCYDPELRSWGTCGKDQ